MLLEEYVTRLKKSYDIQRSEELINFLSKILPNGCYPTIQPGTGILEISCPSMKEADEVWNSHQLFLNRITTERISIKVFGEEYLTTSTNDLITAWTNYEDSSTHMNNNPFVVDLYQDRESKRIIEQVYNCETKSVSIVSLETHTNLVFNQALIHLLGTSPKEIRSRDLKAYWLKPEEMRPGAIDSAKLPPQLEEVIGELKQCSLLKKRPYQGWLNDKFGLWTADIEAMYFQGEWVRKMTTHDFQELVA